MQVSAAGHICAAGSMVVPQVPPAPTDVAPAWLEVMPPPLVAVLPAELPLPAAEFVLPAEVILVPAELLVPALLPLLPLLFEPPHAKTVAAATTALAIPYLTKFMTRPW